MPTTLEIVLHFQIVIEFSIKDEPVRSVVERLVCALIQVDDAQAGMQQIEILLTRRQPVLVRGMVRSSAPHQFDAPKQARFRNFTQSQIASYSAHTIIRLLVI